MGEFVWKTLWKNDSRPFIFQKEIFLKEIYLTYGFVGFGSGWRGLEMKYFGACVGEFVWKTLRENDSRPFIFQKEIFLKEIYLSYGFVGFGSGWRGLE